MLLTPEECVPVAAAIVRVFIEHGDRTDRKKARLKYVLDRWGFDKFLEEIEKQLPAARSARSRSTSASRAGRDRPAAATSASTRRSSRAVYVGVVLPVGRMTCRPDARPGRRSPTGYGSGTIRLTVWQNLLISDIPDDDVDDVKRAIEALGLHWDATSVRGGLVACTGNAGCKFAGADTKRHAMEIADYLEARLELDQPINIHLTGCHALVRPALHRRHRPARRRRSRSATTMVEGYHVFVGGGYGAEQGDRPRAVPRRPGDRRPAGRSSGCCAATWPTAQSPTEIVRRIRPPARSNVEHASSESRCRSPKDADSP